jgi:hypothetical protein
MLAVLNHYGTPELARTYPDVQAPQWEIVPTQTDTDLFVAPGEPVVQAYLVVANLRVWRETLTARSAATFGEALQEAQEALDRLRCSVRDWYHDVVEALHVQAKWDAECCCVYEPVPGFDDHLYREQGTGRVVWSKDGSVPHGVFARIEGQRWFAVDFREVFRRGVHKLTPELLALFSKDPCIMLPLQGVSVERSCAWLHGARAIQMFVEMFREEIMQAAKEVCCGRR